MDMCSTGPAATLQVSPEVVLRKMPLDVPAKRTDGAVRSTARAETTAPPGSMSSRFSELSAGAVAAGADAGSAGSGMRSAAAEATGAAGAGAGSGADAGAGAGDL